MKFGTLTWKESDNEEKELSHPTAGGLHFVLSESGVLVKSPWYENKSTPFTEYIYLLNYIENEFNPLSNYITNF